jgi:hypothetical protein
MEGQSSTSETGTTGSTAAQQTGTTAQTSTTEGQSGQTGTTEGGGATTTTETPWQDNLAGDLKTNPLFRDYKSVDELAKAHDNLVKLKGAKPSELLKIPAKTRDQDPEAWKAFDAVRGVPADPKEYKFELAPEAAADAGELAGTLRELGTKASLDPHQMAVVVSTLNDLGKKAAEAEATALNAETTATTEALKKEWGAQFDGNQRGIGKMIREALGGEIDDAAMADLQTQIGSNLTVSRVLAHALSKMAEPENPDGDSQRAAATKQMTPTQATAALNAFQADPEKMKALTQRNHPQHAAVMEERRQLLAWQTGEKRVDQPKSA